MGKATGVSGLVQIRTVSERTPEFSDILLFLIHFPQQASTGILIQEARAGICTHST
jgi:hypothetical protein